MQRPASSSMGARLRVLLLVALTASATGCADRQMQPARQAIDDIEAALATSGTAPIKYIPGEVSAVRDDLDALKQAFEQEDYAAVLRDAPAVLAAARALPQEAAAREADLLQRLQADWAAMETTMPAAIADMRGRVTRLAATRTLPEGMTRDDLDQAARRVEDAQALWERALAERSAQRLPEAVTLAQQASELVKRVAEERGLGAPVGPVK